MTSFFRRLGLTPNASNTQLPSTSHQHDGFYTAKTTDALFPRTTEDIDGERCLHDCETCTIKLPRGFKIEEDDQLYGHINGWSRHLIVATGKTDWVRDVADEQGSVMQAVGAHNESVEGGKLMLSASNMPLPDGDARGVGPYGKDRETRVLLLPAFQFVDGATPRRVPDLIRAIINATPTNTEPLSHPKPLHHPNRNGIDRNGKLTPDSPPATPTHTILPAGFKMMPCPHKYVILMCSQATRDARCGQSAPLLRRELERHLRPLGLYRDLGDERPDGVGIYFISHVGGHKYSANFMIYRRADAVEGHQSAGKETGSGEVAQCIWLARVRPEDCENIVRFTVLQGKVVKPERQLRGGFDRVRGLVSW